MQNKLIAHNQLIDGSADQYRNSFFRVNDIEELNGAIVDYCHLPLVAHLGFDVRYKSPVGGAMPRKVLNTTLWFLSKADSNTLNRADAIEGAYVEADQVLTQFLSYMLADQENCPCCDFDFETAKVEMIGPELNELYGWQLTIQDSKRGAELEYNPQHWLNEPATPPIHEEPEDPTPEPEEDPAAANKPEFIPLEGSEQELVIEWDDARRALFGEEPTFHLWYQESDGLRLSNTIIIHADQAPPLTTYYTLSFNVPAPALLTIKK